MNDTGYHKQCSALNINKLNLNANLIVGTSKLNKFHDLRFVGQAYMNGIIPSSMVFKCFDEAENDAHL